MIVPEVPKKVKLCQAHPTWTQFINTTGLSQCAVCSAMEGVVAEEDACIYCHKPWSKAIWRPMIVNSPWPDKDKTFYDLVCDSCYEDLLAQHYQDVMSRYLEKAGILHPTRVTLEVLRHTLEAYQYQPNRFHGLGLTVDGAAQIKSSILDLDNSLEDARLVVWREDLWSAATRGNIAFHDTDWSFAGLVTQIWLLQSREPVYLYGVDGRAFGPTPLKLVGYILKRIGNTLHPYWVVEVIEYNLLTRSPERGLNLIKGSQEGLPGKEFQINTRIPEWFCPLAAAAAFMDMEFVTFDRQRPSREVRRRIVRSGKSEPEVNIITLRRSVSDKGEGANEGRVWSCCWMVAPHWKRQWMPSKGTWEPRYILTYQKGDPSKPLKQPKDQTVYYVKR